MVGGAPIFMPQQMPQAAPRMPQQGVTPAQQAGGYVPPKLTPPSRAAAPQPPAPRLARGVRPSSTDKGPVAIPTPEELGVGAFNSATLDWAATRKQLATLGATSFQLEHVSGGARFRCWIDGKMVQADAATEAEAVRQCMERAAR